MDEHRMAMAYTVQVFPRGVDGGLPIIVIEAVANHPALVSGQAKAFGLHAPQEFCQAAGFAIDRLKAFAQVGKMQVGVHQPGPDRSAV